MLRTKLQGPQNSQAPASSGDLAACGAEAGRGAASLARGALRMSRPQRQPQQAAAQSHSLSPPGPQFTYLSDGLASTSWTSPSGPHRGQPFGVGTSSSRKARVASPPQGAGYPSSPAPSNSPQTHLSGTRKPSNLYLPLWAPQRADAPQNFWALRPHTCTRTNLAGPAQGQPENASPPWAWPRLAALFSGWGHRSVGGRQAGGGRGLRGTGQVGNRRREGEGTRLPRWWGIEERMG